MVASCLKVIEEMRKKNKGVIFISHDLEELMNVRTIITVLRDGDIIGTPRRTVRGGDHQTMMVGRELTAITTAPTTTAMWVKRSS